MVTPWMTLVVRDRDVCDGEYTEAWRLDDLLDGLVELVGMGAGAVMTGPSSAEWYFRCTDSYLE